MILKNRNIVLNVISKVGKYSTNSIATFPRKFCLVDSETNQFNSKQLLRTSRGFSTSRPNFYHVKYEPNRVEIFESASEATKDITSNSTVLIGGFGVCGVPENIVNALAEHDSTNELTIVSNDAGLKDIGVGLLIKNKKVKRLISSYVAENRDCEKQFFDGELELELVPQGTLAEKIRCGGAGIPAFFTHSGVDTIVHMGGLPIKLKGDREEISSLPKKTEIFDNKAYIMEKSIKADFALIKAWKADKAGNLIFHKTAQNFNKSMGKAAKVTIAEVEEIVETGDLDPNFIHLPGIYVDRLVTPSHVKRIYKRTYKKNDLDTETDPLRERIARRAALEFKDGMYANLGIGMPELSANYIPKSLNVTLQSENGILGLGPYPEEADIDPDCTNAGKETVSVISGACYVDSSESFSIIRGGHLQMTMLGGMQVSKNGSLANWMVPGKKVKGMGGAMDLVGSINTRVVVVMKHLTKNGEFKIVDRCTLPLTGSKCVDLIITEKCVFEVVPHIGLVLIELADGVDVDEITKSTACDFTVSKNLKPMGQA